MSSEHLTIKIAIVDDEAPARKRLQALLEDISDELSTVVVATLDNGLEALRYIEENPVDLVLLDINMPIMDGLEAANHMNKLERRPQVVFVTAFDEHAIRAFELSATDYLLKPVSAERLLQALQKSQIKSNTVRPLDLLPNIGERRNFSVSERGRIELVPVHKVLYLKAEHKYVTARTSERDYLLDESLVQLEEEFGERFVRIHRNCLIAREHFVCVERDGLQNWQAVLLGLDERLDVSRRQWPLIKALIKESQ